MNGRERIEALLEESIIEVMNHKQYVIADMMLNNVKNTFSKYEVYKSKLDEVYQR